MINMKDNIVYYTIINKNTIKGDLSKYYGKSIETKKAYYLLEKVLNHFNIDMVDIIFSKNGKPHLENNNVYFNYSHSKNYILLAISKCEVGVDIEEDRKIYDTVSNKYLNGAGPEERLKYWVIKESYVKLIDEPYVLYENIDLNKLEKSANIIHGSDYIASIISEKNYKISKIKKTI